MCTNPDLSQTALRTHTDTHAHMRRIRSDDNILPLTNKMSRSYQSSDMQLHDRKY